jgi:ribosomal-protein-alanine N-acetyltransferase
MTAAGAARRIAPGEILRGGRVSLRLVTLEDCTDRYESWLADPIVNQYLETRWRPQPLEAIREFVAGMVESSDSYLFAILENESGRHVGNIKVGPIVWNHLYADVSYFIGERSCWGKGYASEAIRLATGFGFHRLGLHRLQAGLYASNGGSGKALQKVGYRHEAVFKGQLKIAAGAWEDHHWFAMLRDDWRQDAKQDAKDETRAQARDNNQ